jgi:hypothetical protein
VCNSSQNLALVDALARKDGCSASTRAARMCDVATVALGTLRATSAYWFATAAALALLRVACNSMPLAASLLRGQRDENSSASSRDVALEGAVGVRPDVVKHLSATISKGKEGVLIGRHPTSAWRAVRLMKDHVPEPDQKSAEARGGGSDL